MPENELIKQYKASVAKEKIEFYSWLRASIGVEKVIKYLVLCEYDSQASDHAKRGT
jgi:hypothetical protein